MLRPPLQDEHPPLQPAERPTEERALVGERALGGDGDDGDGDDG